MTFGLCSEIFRLLSNIFPASLLKMHSMSPEEFLKKYKGFWEENFFLLFADVGCKSGTFFKKWLAFIKYILHVQSQFLRKKIFFSFCSLFLDLDQKLDYRKKVRIIVKIFMYVSRRVFWEKIIPFNAFWFICSSVLTEK